ncbi:MAG TPA: hypothetical protein VGQ20_10780 [Acidimicrobiales bacterium]|jgi:EAL domain-containing protein (putative c-di-GMP-specific phosphodiesterase class I)|nr:hypothetical protein [Acidimicrobiales bacterium]
MSCCRDLGVRFGQGYYLARPVPIASQAAASAAIPSLVLTA